VFDLLAPEFIKQLLSEGHRVLVLEGKLCLDIQFFRSIWHTFCSNREHVTVFEWQILIGHIARS
jgi:hypothetical protein